MKVLRLIIPEVFKWTMSHADDADMYEAMRQDMENLINVSATGDEEDRDFLRELNTTLTEELSNRELPLALRKVYRELSYKIGGTLISDKKSVEGSIANPPRIAAR